MYIQKDLTTTSEYIDGISWEISEELLSKLYLYGSLSELVFDENEEYIIDVVEKRETADHKVEEDFASEQSILLYTKNKIRKRRDDLLCAFDVYKSNVFYGIITETDDERSEIMSWYHSILDLPNTISEDNLEYKWPKIPANISKYIVKESISNREINKIRSRIRG